MSFRLTALAPLLLLGGLPLAPASVTLAAPAPVTTSLGTLPITPGDDNAALALKAPAFAGLWVNGPGVVIMVTSTDEAARRTVLNEVRRTRGQDLSA